MRLVKATLFGLIVASLTMMWTNREFVTEAYEITDNPLQVRLSGVDLAVDPSDVGPSPFALPKPRDTRRAILPFVSPVGAALDVVEKPIEIEMTDGELRLFGTVSGNDGPVAGATVAIERLTTEGIGEVRVQTNAEGKWVAAKLPGGKYRVRAWIPGLLTSGGSEVRYIATDEKKAEFAFTILGIDQTPTIEFVHGGSIYEGHGGAVAMAMAQRTIDENGVIVTAPVVGSLITVRATSEVTLASSPTQLTNVDGLAYFTLTCRGAVSGGTITATSGLQSKTFGLPGCRPIPVPEPEPEPEPDPAPGTPIDSSGTVTVDG